MRYHLGPLPISIVEGDGKNIIIWGHPHFRSLYSISAPTQWAERYEKMWKSGKLDASKSKILFQCCKTKSKGLAFEVQFVSHYFPIIFGLYCRNALMLWKMSSAFGALFFVVALIENLFSPLTPKSFSSLTRQQRRKWCIAQVTFLSKGHDPYATPLCAHPAF